VWALSVAAPGPGTAATVEEFTARLRAVREWAGNPAYSRIACRIDHLRRARAVPPGERRPAKVTVYDCFRPDRRRLDIELVTDILRALGVPEADVSTWRRAYGRCTGRTGAAG